jgi:hypothetical protein
MSLLRPEGSQDDQAGEAVSCDRKPRVSKLAQWAIRTVVHLDQIVLVVVRPEAGPVTWWPKMLKE